MKVVVVAATKGGVGKSTLAVALAISAIEDGERVGLVDCDPQGSTRDWNALRGSPAEPALYDAPTLTEALIEAKSDKRSVVVVDTPPGGFGFIEPAVRQADLVIIPVRPSPMDLLGVNAIVGLCDEHKRPWVFVLNQVSADSAFASEAVAHLKSTGTLLKTNIALREAYSLAMAHGRTASELVWVGRGGGDAREEMQAVWKEVKKLLTSKKSGGKKT